MTRNATEFIGPHTFDSLTHNRTMVDTFDRNFQNHVEHVALADKADLLIVAPATANVLAKAAHGIADDMLTTTILACSCPKLAAPAMNTRMYENPVTQDNLETLRRYGWQVIEPKSGRLAWARCRSRRSCWKRWTTRCGMRRIWPVSGCW